MYMPKAVKKAFDIFSSIVVVVVVILAIMLVGVRLVGLQVFAVLSGSMEPNYHTGALIYVKPVEPHDLQTGDVITYMVSEDTVVTHRIAGVVPDDEDPNIWRFRTKGDANEQEDSILVHEANVIGTPVFTIPYMGYITDYIQNPPGTYYAIAIGAMVMMIMFIPDLLEEDEPKQEKPRKKKKKASDQEVEKEAEAEEQPVPEASGEVPVPVIPAEVPAAAAEPEGKIPAAAELPKEEAKDSGSPVDIKAVEAALTALETHTAAPAPVERKAEAPKPVPVQPVAKEPERVKEKSAEKQPKQPEKAEPRQAEKPVKPAAASYHDSVEDAFAALRKSRASAAPVPDLSGAKAPKTAAAAQPSAPKPAAKPAPKAAPKPISKAAPKTDGDEFDMDDFLAEMKDLLG